MLKSVIFLLKFIFSTHNNHLPEFLEISIVFSAWDSGTSCHDVHVIAVAKDVSIALCSFLSYVDLVHNLLRLWILTGQKTF